MTLERVHQQLNKRSSITFRSVCLNLWARQSTSHVEEKRKRLERDVH